MITIGNWWEQEPFHGECFYVTGTWFTDDGIKIKRRMDSCWNKDNYSTILINGHTISMAFSRVLTAYDWRFVQWKSLWYPSGIPLINDFLFLIPFLFIFFIFFCLYLIFFPMIIDCWNPCMTLLVFPFLKLLSSSSFPFFVSFSFQILILSFTFFLSLSFLICQGFIFVSSK